MRYSVPNLCGVALWSDLDHKAIQNWSPPAFKKPAAACFFNTRSKVTAHAQCYQLAHSKSMLVCVSIAGGFLTILPWTIMVVEESCSLVDLYAGIRDGTVKVPSARGGFWYQNKCKDPVSQDIWHSRISCTPIPNILGYLAPP